MYHSKMNSTEKLNKTNSRMKMANSFCNSGSPKRSQVKNFIIPQTNLIKESLIHKNMKLNIMIRNLHSFATSIEQLDWIMLQAQKIIGKYMKQTVNQVHQSNKIQIQNIHKQLLKLIERFSGINKREIQQATIREQMLTQNQNTMNMKKTATTRSFKLMETQPHYENEEQFGQFSKINLPPTIKENVVSQNIMSERFENEQKIKQYENTIQILKQSIEKEKDEKNRLKINLQSKILGLQEKLQEWKMNWKSYEVFSKGTIRKCKQYLTKIAEEKSFGQKQEIQDYLDELFHWQNKISNGVTDNQIEMNSAKQEMAQELAQLQFKLRQKKTEIRKMETYKLAHKQAQQPNFQHNNNILAMLYAQATTIQRLI